MSEDNRKWYQILIYTYSTAFLGGSLALLIGWIVKSHI